MKTTAGTRANETFMSGFNCAQSVFSAFGDELKLDRASLLKMTTGFAGGMAMNGHTCGAVVGAYLALGAKFGRDSLEDTVSKDRVNELIEQFNYQFMSLHGSLNCRELVEVNLKTEEGRAAFSNENMKQEKCSRYVADAARICDELLKNND